MNPSRISSRLRRIIAVCMVISAVAIPLTLVGSSNATDPAQLTVTDVTASAQLVLSDGSTVTLAHAHLPLTNATSSSCGTDDAHAALAGLVLGKSVERQGEHALSVAGKDAATEIVRAGWATPDIQGASPALSEQIMAASEEARIAGRGWWATCAPSRP